MNATASYTRTADFLQYVLSTLVCVPLHLLHVRLKQQHHHQQHQQHQHHQQQQQQMQLERRIVSEYFPSFLAPA
jgi:transcription initiation factor TFIID subunit TAF12